MPKYSYPGIEEGTVSQGAHVYTIVDGVVECPVEFAVANGLVPVVEKDEKKKAVVTKP